MLSPKRHKEIQTALAIRNGSEKVFAEFFSTHVTPLFHYLTTKTTAAEIAQDLAQEAFIKLWHNRHKIKLDGYLKAYLYRIAINLTIDYHRKHAKIQNRQVAYDVVLKVEKHQPQQVNLQSELTEVAETLPPNYRTTFLLSRLEGYKNKEIADALNISIKTVESRLAKSRTMLRTQMAA